MGRRHTYPAGILALTLWASVAGAQGNWNAAIWPSTNFPRRGVQRALEASNAVAERIAFVTTTSLGWDHGLTQPAVKNSIRREWDNLRAIRAAILGLVGTHAFVRAPLRDPAVLLAFVKTNYPAGALADYPTNVCYQHIEDVLADAGAPTNLWWAGAPTMRSDYSGTNGWLFIPAILDQLTWTAYTAPTAGATSTTWTASASSEVFDDAVSAVINGFALLSTAAGRAPQADWNVSPDLLFNRYNMVALRVQTTYLLPTNTAANFYLCVTNGDSQTYAVNDFNANGDGFTLGFNTVAASGYSVVAGPTAPSTCPAQCEDVGLGDYGYKGYQPIAEFWPFVVYQAEPGSTYRY